MLVLDARTATDHFPGIGRYVTSLATALQLVAPDWPITCLQPPPDRATRLTLPAGLAGVPCPASPFSLQQQWQVPAQLRQLRATLYHSPYYLMPYRPGVPTVLTCYDLIPLLFPAYYPARQRLIYYAAHQLALRTARMVLCISQATRADLRRYFHLDPRRVVVTPLAAAAHFRPQPPAAVAALREQYGLPAHYLLYVGSNKPHKNLPRLVEAFIQARLPVNLVIAGPWDPRYPQAKELARPQPQIKFIGPVPEAALPALYSGAQAFVFPSLYEGFGLPVLEAMACGAPVVCSTSSALPEVVGEAGLLFDPQSAPALTAALTRLATEPDLPAGLRQRSLARAGQFSWEQTARQTLAAYTQVKHS